MSLQRSLLCAENSKYFGAFIFCESSLSIRHSDPALFKCYYLIWICVGEFVFDNACASVDQACVGDDAEFLHL